MARPCQMYWMLVRCTLKMHEHNTSRLTHSKCLVCSLADENTEFGDFVFFDMPGWQSEYASDCTYRTYFQQLLDKVDFTYVVW